MPPFMTNKLKRHDIHVCRACVLISCVRWLSGGGGASLVVRPERRRDGRQRMWDCQIDREEINTQCVMSRSTYYYLYALYNIAVVQWSAQN